MPTRGSVDRGILAAVLWLVLWSPVLLPLAVLALVLSHTGWPVLDDQA